MRTAARFPTKSVGGGFHEPKKATQKSAKSTIVINEKSAGFTDEERAAMKERAQEARRGPRADKADGESDVLAKIAEMPGTGSRHGPAAPCCHQSQRASPLAENLVRDARVCQGRQGSSASSKARRSSNRGTRRSASATRRTSTRRHVATAYALKEWTAAEEARIGALVKKAVS